jgi:hypothetical protein
VSDPITIEWDYASREDELEAIRWYLTGHLDLQTKLDLRLGTAVNIYEYLRHAVKRPNLKFLQLPMKAIGAYELIWPDPETGQWLKVPEFPQLPFTKLTADSRETVLRFLDAKFPAFQDVGVQEFVDWGIAKALSKLAKVSKYSKERVIAEVEVCPQISVIPFVVDFSKGPKEAERAAVDWIRQNRHRFTDGRSLAGRRAGDNPCLGLKDLAVTRLLYFHNSDVKEARKWARKSHPRDPNDHLIPWFNKRGAKPFSDVLKDPRDWMLAVPRFKKNLQGFTCSQ